MTKYDCLTILANGGRKRGHRFVLRAICVAFPASSLAKFIPKFIVFSSAPSVLASSLHVIRIQARPWGPSRERWWRISCRERRRRAAPPPSIGSGAPPPLNKLERSAHPQAQFPYCTATPPRWRRWVFEGCRACPTAADTLNRAQRRRVLLERRFDLHRRRRQSRQDR